MAERYNDYKVRNVYTNLNMGVVSATSEDEAAQLAWSGFAHAKERGYLADVLATKIRN